MSQCDETKKQRTLSISESNCVGIWSVNAIRFCMWVQLNETPTELVILGGLLDLVSRVTEWNLNLSLP